MKATSNRSTLIQRISYWSGVVIQIAFLTGLLTLGLCKFTVVNDLGATFRYQGY